MRREQSTFEVVPRLHKMTCADAILLIALTIPIAFLTISAIVGALILIQLSIPVHG